MRNGIDIDQLTNYELDLLKASMNFKNGKQAKSFLRAEGTKLKRKTLATAKRKVKKDTGNYFKSIKRGKFYVYSGNGAWSIRVYSNAPHAHLIEEGHRQVTSTGKEVGFVPGKKVFKESQKDFEGEYFDDVQRFLDYVIDEGLVR